MVKGLALFWQFLIECLAFFSNFVGRFWPFLTEGLAFFENINLATMVAGTAVCCSNASVLRRIRNKRSDRLRINGRLLLRTFERISLFICCF